MERNAKRDGGKRWNHAGNNEKEYATYYRAGSSKHQQPGFDE
jgi:hypothetical protein